MIQRRGLLTLALFVVIALAGCAPKVHIALEPDIVPLLTDVECKNVVIEDEVSVAINVSKGGEQWIGGCLGAMIDNAENKARSRKAEELALPLLEQTPDVDLRRQLGTALEYTIKDIEWLNIDDVRSTAAIPHPDELKSIVKPMLQLNSSYRLVPKCYSLDISMQARIWLPNENKAVFLGHYTYFSAPVSDMVEDAAVAAWASDGATAYRASLDEGVAEIVKMLRFDLPPDGNLPNIKEGDWKKIKFLWPSTNKTVSWKCQILAETDGRIIFRLQNGGNIWSIPTTLIDMDALKDPKKSSVESSVDDFEI